MNSTPDFQLRPKRSYVSIAIVFLSLIFFSVIPLQGQIPLYTKQTKNLRLVYYDRNHSYLLSHLSCCFENSLKFHRKLFDYTPTEEVTVLLQDWNDYGNAGTNTIPWNYINLGIEPYDYVYETSPTNERMNWVMNHELVHVVATDKATSSDKFFRALLGGKVAAIAANPISMIYSYLTTPRWYSPRWYHEGIAVFMETWMSGGIGRALNGYDEMVFRTMVLDTSYFYDVVGLESEGTTIDFQIGVNSYLYGTRFVSYLVYRYGIDKLLKWFNRTRDSKRYFSSQFKHVYGNSLDTEWSRWIEWEHKWQRANLDSIRQYATTPHRNIIPITLGSVSRAYYDSTAGKIYVGVNYPGQIAHIASIDINAGTMQKICNVPTPALYYVTSLAFSPSVGKLFFSTHNSSSWRDVCVVDIKTGKAHVLLKNARIGDLVFNQADKSLWGVRHHNGYSTLVRMPCPYQQFDEIFPIRYGKDIFDIDISPDGKYLIGSLIEINGRQRLILMKTADLLGGNSSYEVLYEFEDNSPENFVFSPDGRYLYGTSYYSGVSNVYRYDLQQNDMEALTNCETGFFRPLPISNDSLIVFRYTRKGFLPVMIPIRVQKNIKAITFLGQKIVEKYPIVKSWKLQPPSPKRINIDSLTIAQGSYKGLTNLKLASAYPIVEGFKDFAAAGMRINFFDPLGVYGLDITASYSPNKALTPQQRFHFDLNASIWQWTLTASYNRADFYDLFGPTKTSRKGYSLGLQYNNYLIYDKPRLLDYSIKFASYAGLERLPDFQNIAVSFDRFLTLRAKLNYSYLLKSLGAVEYEQGLSAQLITNSNYVNSKLFPQLIGNLNYGFLLPIHHCSLWFRSSAGYSPGDRDEPFANFYFGGFGNNWVDYQAVKRYREFYSFPGVELNEIAGTNYGKLLVEWVLPPIRFKRFGFTSMYFRWTHLSLFLSGIVTNFDSKKYRRSLLNFGAQLDLRLVTFSLLKSTFSLGYAVAVEKDQNISSEFMVSLKIL